MSRVAAVVLAAGAGSRFGGSKLLAPLDGRPVLQHVLDSLAAAGLRDVVVVLGDDADRLEAAIEWRTERRIRNPSPGRGLSSSLLLGFEAASGAADAILVVLGDQPLLSARAVAALVEAPADGNRPIVVPRFEADGARNPVLIRRPAFDRIQGAAGDRGLGPLISEYPELVMELSVPGSNPDVDTRNDLRTLDLEAAWAARVRANRDQVERFREQEDGADFYAPVSSLFVADPRRTSEPALSVLRSLAQPGESWLDIGAGAGRYALPLALVVGGVIAVEPSVSMRHALRTGMAEHGVTNIRIVGQPWPDAAADLGDSPAADVALIAHVGYDIEAIGPFLDAMDRHARRLSVAVMTDQSPASVADPFWPLVHGEARVPLPALPELVELLAARGHEAEVVRVERAARTFDSIDALEVFLRRQLWVAPGSAKDGLFQDALTDLATKRDGGWTLVDPPAGSIGIVSWVPTAGSANGADDRP